MEIRIPRLNHEQYCKIIDYIDNSAIEDENYSFTEGNITSNRGNILRLESAQLEGNPVTYTDVVIRATLPINPIGARETIPNYDKVSRILNEKAHSKVKGLVDLVLE